MTDQSPSTVATPTGPTAESAPPAAITREFVRGRVRRIQEGYLRHPKSSWSRASLAQLRRGVGREVGSVPEILELTINPDAARVWSDAPTPDEIAIHTAMTLYAVHQQSLSRPMHVPRVPFGSALGAIRYVDGRESAGVVRRFQAMGTASSVEELVHHARTLITLLRRAECGFDYGLFAEDIAAFQNPRRADLVRLRWGRDFYRIAAPTPTPSTTATEEPS